MAIPPLPPNLQGIGIFWVRAEDYERFLDICTDRLNLPPTYEEWLSQVNQRLQQFEGRGLNLVKVIVDLDELIAWCRATRRKIDADSRTAYASYKTAIQIRPGNDEKH